MINNRRITSRGFTLLEILIALTLSAMIMLMLALGMKVVLKEWTSASNQLDHSIDKVLLLLQIERAIEGAFPYTYWDQEENKQYLFFEGNEKQMAWISTVSPGRQAGMMAWHLLPNAADTSGIDLRIVAACAGNPTVRLKNHATTLTVLPEYTASFEYLYRDIQFQEKTEWLKTWSAQERQSLPNAIRITFKHEIRASLELIAVILTDRHRRIRPSLKP